MQGQHRGAASPTSRATRLGYVALAVALSGVLTGCNGSSSASDPLLSPTTSASTTEPLAPVPTGLSEGPTPSGSASPSTSVTPGAVDPAHAVAPPGPLEDPLLGPDMLVYSPESLSPEKIEAIRDLAGVKDVETLALAQVSVENRVINVAAIDPSTYRRYTPVNSAQELEVWRRVAGGELAIVPGLGRKVEGSNGYLQLGNESAAPTVHIGAFAPQIPQVDAVINDKWGEALGMKPDNALIVNTGIHSPQSLRPKIQSLAGEKASVQILGPNLDISVQQTAFLVGTVADAVGTFNYTVLGGGRIAPDPAWVASHIVTESVPILGSVTCNRLIFPQLRAALAEVVARGLADKIHPDEYAGCYNARFIAGTTKLSNHSFGLALDLNVPGNQRGTVGEIDRNVVSIFQKWGFTWGGDWSYTDPMHFEMNALVQPR